MFKPPVLHRHMLMSCAFSLMHSWGSVCLANLGGSCLHSRGSWREAHDDRGFPPSSEAKRVWVTFPHRRLVHVNTPSYVVYPCMYIVCKVVIEISSLWETVYLWINGLLTPILIIHPCTYSPILIIHPYMYFFRYESSIHVYLYT